MIMLLLAGGASSPADVLLAANAGAFTALCGQDVGAEGQLLPEPVGFPGTRSLSTAHEWSQLQCRCTQLRPFRAHRTCELGVAREPDQPVRRRRR